jgi:hypothetical protein
MKHDITPIPLLPMAFIGIVMSLYGMGRHVSAAGVDWQAEGPFIIWLAASIGFIWKVTVAGFATEQLPTTPAALKAWRFVTLAVGLLAVWIGWITFRESPIGSGNFMFFWFLVTGFLIFLPRSFPPHGASNKSATRRR